MILEDFVMLGTTVPEPNSDGRVFVCSAGYSAELKSLVRIYPLARRSVPHRWDIHRIALERNRRDSRAESWQIAGDRSTGEHADINQRFERLATIRDIDRMALLRGQVVGSIKEADARRQSLAIIHPESAALEFDHNPDSPDSPQLALFDRPGDTPSGARRFAWMPKLVFRDELGWHRLMLRDWGAFELQRKKGPDYFRQHLAGALHLSGRSSLLIGNMNNQRTAWLVISVLNGIREAPTLFDALPSQRPHLSDKLRREVYQRDGWKCVRCGSADRLTVDHRWPHSRGGNTSLENLETLCNTCNLAKNDSTAVAV